ncbi:MAG: phage holin family protein [Pseudomonadota bacterium]
MEWLHKLVDETVAGTAALGALIGIAVTGLRTAFRRRWHDWREFAAGLAGAVLVSGLASLALQSMEMPQTMRVAMIGALAYISDAILEGLSVIGQMLARNPLDAARRVVAVLRGQPLPPDDPRDGGDR